MSTLYELKSAYLDILEQSEFGDIPVDQSLELIEQLEFEIKDKAINVAAYIQNQQMLASAIHDAERKMAERRRAINSRIESLKDYLRVNMVETGIQKIECPEFRITLAKAREQVVIDDLIDVPDQYIKIKIEPDKAAIKAAIKAGEHVKGARIELGQPSVLIK